MHSRLETYLNEVSSHLGALPGKRRDEEVREMRAHLEAAHAAGLARGQSEDEAARDVLAQFGAAEEVGAETVTAWRRGRSLDRRSLWGAAAFATVLLMVMPRLLRPVDMAFWRQFGAHAPALAMAFLTSWSVVECLLIGWGVGVLFPRRAVSAVGLAWSARILWSLAFQSLQMAHASAWFAYPLAYTPQQALLSGFFVLFSLAAAWSGSRWRTARVGRMRAARG